MPTQKPKGPTLLDQAQCDRLCYNACRSTWVGRRLDVTLYDEWGETPPRTQIVAINAPVIQEEFKSCAVEP
jgi:hypothetical protein